MIQFFATRRASILLPSGPAANRNQKHLFILLTDPVGDLREILLIGISSAHPGMYVDETCLLYPGDHPFINRRSYVRYADAAIQQESKIINGINAGLFVPQEPIEGGIFARICLGLSQSRHTAPKVLKFYRDLYPHE